MPKALLASWFPGASLPLGVELQVEVDGPPWGARFASTIIRGMKGKGQLTRGLGAFPQLLGCPVVAFRRAAGPGAALDVVLSSLGEKPRVEGTQEWRVVS